MCDACGWALLALSASYCICAMLACAACSAVCISIRAVHVQFGTSRPVCSIAFALCILASPHNMARSMLAVRGEERGAASSYIQGVGTSATPLTRRPSAASRVFDLACSGVEPPVAPTIGRGPCDLRSANERQGAEDLSLAPMLFNFVLHNAPLRKCPHPGGCACLCSICCCSH